jgi:dienelactone hydrolase
VNARTSTFLVICLVLVTLSGCGAIEGGLIYFGLVSKETDPAVLNRKLEAHDEWYLSEVTRPSHPGVLLVPGCAGTHAFHRTWARFFVESGFIALLIDSFQARGIKTEAELEDVCEGEKLWGFERAGDVLLSLHRLRSHPLVNPEEVYAVGWSHGGWAVLDAVALGAREERLPMLSEELDGSLSGVRGIAAIYPYCGFGNHVARFGWPDKAIEGLFVIAENDANIESVPCIELAERLQQQQQPIELLRVDAQHWFDNPEGFDLAPHVYSDDAAEQTRSRILALFGDRT